MSYKIENTAKLPFKYTKGDTKSTNDNVIAANERLFEAMMNEPENMKFENLERLLQDEFILTGSKEKLETIPKITIKTIDLNGLDNYGHEITGSESEIINDGKIVGYEITAKGEDNTLTKESIAAFMHAVTHTFNSLFQPKTIARIASIDLTDQQLQKTNNFYQKVLYTEENLGVFNEIFARIKMNSALKTLTPKQKIDILQQWKSALETADFAYWQSEKFSALAGEKGYQQEELANGDNFLFSEKIEFLNKEIFKLIKKERKAIKQDLANSPKTTLDTSV